MEPADVQPGLSRPAEGAECRCVCDDEQQRRAAIRLGVPQLLVRGVLPGPQKVEIQVKLGSGGAIGGVGVPASGQATLYRVDADHANAAKVWQNSMSSVATPDAAQLAQLQAAAMPTAESVAVSISGRAASLTIDSVPPNSAYVVTLR